MTRRCTVNYCGIKWTVEGNYRKGSPAMFYLPNGDPGYPVEPSELTDIEITIKQGTAYSDELTPVLQADAISTIIDRALVAMDEDDGPEIPW